MIYFLYYLLYIFEKLFSLIFETLLFVIRVSMFRLYLYVYLKMNHYR